MLCRGLELCVSLCIVLCSTLVCRVELQKGQKQTFGNDNRETIIYFLSFNYSLQQSTQLCLVFSVAPAASLCMDGTQHVRRAGSYRWRLFLKQQQTEQMLLFACLFICFKPYLNFKNHFLKNPVMLCSHIFYFVDFIAAPYCSGSHFWLANEGFIPAALMEFSCIVFILFCLFGFILFYLFKLFHGELVIGVFNFKKNLIISPI